MDCVKLMGVSESSIAMLAYATGVGNSLIKAFANTPWILYLGK